jgi:PAS domain S-box-containing protein
LRQSERQYHQILNSIPDLVLVKGPQSRIVWANQAFCEYYGLSTETLQGMIDAEFVEPDITQQYIIDDTKVFNSGIALDIPEERVTRHDGEVRLFNTVKSPIFNETRDVIMTVGVSRDITDRKIIEQEHARLASIVETTSDFIGSAQLDGSVIYLNPAGRRMIGVASDADLSQRHIPDFSPAWANEVINGQGISAVMRDGTWTGETALKDANLREIPVSQTILLHRKPDGTPAFLSTIARDISDQKRASAERERLIKDLQAARRIAEENSRLKSEFLATMSHELRTPLNAIEGFTSIMLSKMGGSEYNDKTERYISRVNTNSKRLLSLINDFLDLSRVESGRLQLANMPFSPAKLAKRWQEEIGILAEKKAIRFEVSVDSQLPETLHGDEESISKVGLNLLSNAIKFTEQGEVTLTLKQQGAEWQIIVSDTGIGIPPHAREYVFDEFRQVDQTSKRKYGGTGLGLAIVQKYARAMGGSVLLESELGQGSVFTVSLPLTI